MIPDPAFGELCVPPDSGCDRCGGVLTGRMRRWCSKACREWWYRHHRWTQARAEALKRAKRKCSRCGARERLEVDHIIPRNGTPMNPPNCLHHQTNLRVLCHDCHVTRYRWDV